MFRRALPALLVAGLVLPGCTTVKVIATPVTVVRDVVDVPVASLANLFEHWSNQIKPGPPNVGVGVGAGGVHPTLGLNVGYYLFKPLSWILGGVDYLVCRSLYPCWPNGISPWLGTEDSLGSLYFPNTRYLWTDRHVHVDDDDDPPTEADVDG